MANRRGRLAKEEYDRKHGVFDDHHSGFGREDDEANGLANIRGEQSHHNRDWRFTTLTDFLE